MKAETFTSWSVAILAALLVGALITWYHLIMIFQIDPTPIPPCKDFHNCRIIDIDTDGDSAIYDAVLLDTCRHGSLVHFKAEADRFNAGDTAQGNFFGQSK